MPLTGPGNLFNKHCTKERYESYLKTIVKASQNVSHLWSHVMGYIPEGKLPLFSMFGSGYVLMRDEDGKIGLHYALKNDKSEITTPRLNLGHLASILEKAYANGQTEMSPGRLSDSFLDAIEKPFEEYRAIEPRKASRLYDRLIDAYLYD